jgi:hypothetical protein
MKDWIVSLSIDQWHRIGSRQSVRNAIFEAGCTNWESSENATRYGYSIYPDGKMVSVQTHRIGGSECGSGSVTPCRSGLVRFYRHGPFSFKFGQTAHHLTDPVKSLLQWQEKTCRRSIYLFILCIPLSWRKSRLKGNVAIAIQIMNWR